jgi:ketosteroid isomerase-like protein
MAALDVMRRYLEAAKQGDWETASGLFADDILFQIPGRSRFSGEQRGKAAVMDYISTARELSHDADVELEVIDMLASDERVALLVRERFRRSDGVLDIRRANVYRIRDEQIVEVRIFEADQYEVDEMFARAATG